ncbi:hypothetical protein PC116_g25647 [Phytophthora cactorum]|uniref:Uncharacterized protein n=1 Tax=Phytophthora cactorum TaxID=29920 RepID=A0A8T1JMQ8_9STRA|nr:hypothetical protein PC114_g23746 [Phytophthora cactorum]KAG2894843.1 hypothetical protein PC117_g23378 [Phytophthora cactorum]KAG2972598.1 hypothetical protein PC119_g23115 [Phytophthora cactorum]KAG2993379.1 hypothetical protein PC120_g22262 [Phytophthora cactorum]KAG3127605.1 hypothetical protein C6341_g24906 [Phytophthora cactorum]
MPLPKGDASSVLAEAADVRASGGVTGGSAAVPSNLTISSTE